MKPQSTAIVMHPSPVQQASAIAHLMREMGYTIDAAHVSENIESAIVIPVRAETKIGQITATPIVCNITYCYESWMPCYPVSTWHANPKMDIAQRDAWSAINQVINGH